MRTRKNPRSRPGATEIIVRRVQEILSSGGIGRPIIAHVMLFSPFDPTQDHPRGWLGDRARAGGGPMMDMGCHRIEMLLRLFGPVGDVTSWVGRLKIERDIDDTGTAVLQFASGVHATLTVSWAPSERRDSVEIFGDRGTISIPVLGAGTMILRTAAGERTEPLPLRPEARRPLPRLARGAGRGARGLAGARRRAPRPLPWNEDRLRRLRVDLAPGKQGHRGNEAPLGDSTHEVLP